jgi:hypothetical protein
LIVIDDFRAYFFSSAHESYSSYCTSQSCVFLHIKLLSCTCTSIIYPLCRLSLVPFCTCSCLVCVRQCPWSCPCLCSSYIVSCVFVHVNVHCLVCVRQCPWSLPCLCSSSSMVIVLPVFDHVHCHCLVCVRPCPWSLRVCDRQVPWSYPSCVRQIPWSLPCLCSSMSVFIALSVFVQARVCTLPCLCPSVSVSVSVSASVSVSMSVFMFLSILSLCPYL